jgi:sporulation protein YlmC with PRC-barrel domain
MHGLHLVHDVLDGQLVDRLGEKIGRVDELVLELREGQAPRVVAILVGGAQRAERAGRWMLWLRRLWHGGRRSTHEDTSRIPFSAVRSIGETIDVAVDGHTLPSGHVERWLSEHIVCRIPGAMGKEQQ